MSTAQRVEEALGFRVENNLLFHGENPRPATADEQRLWDFAVTAMAANLSFIDQIKMLGADYESVKASCEAYRAQLEKLHAFLAHEYPNIQPTDDAIEFAMAELQKAFESTLTIKPLDARTVRDGFGTPAENKL